MVERVELADGFGYRIVQDGTWAEIVPFGASVRAIWVPDRAGTLRDVCLGYETLEEYAAQGGCLGAVVGRYANRIGGARFTLNGREYPLFANEGANTLHGGKTGFHRRLWELAPRGEDSVACSLVSPDGDEDFPGRLELEVVYTWRDRALTIRYTARCDADTVVNLTNHAYFNLAGQEGGPVDDHIISLRASRFTPIGGDKIVTGALREVAGTPWDLRAPTPLSERLGCPELAATQGFDHNLCLDPGQGPVGRVVCPRTGITMELETDQPGCQLYTAGWLSERPGKAGVVYGPTHGLCLETQNYPNAVNIPSFPSPILRAGETFESETVYRFGTV